jgi:hypothetical protein
MIGLNAAITAANGGTIEQVATGVAIGLVASGVPGADNSLINGGLTGLVGDTIKNDFIASLIIGGTIAKAQGQKFIDGVKGAAIGAAAGALGKSAGLWAKDNVFNGPTASIAISMQTPAIKNTMAVAEPTFAEDSVAFASPSASPGSSQGVIEEVLVTGKMDGCMIVSCTVPNNYSGVLLSGSGGRVRDGADEQAFRVLDTISNYTIKPAAIFVSAPVAGAFGLIDLMSGVYKSWGGSDSQQLHFIGSSLLELIPASAPVQAGRSLYLQVTEDLWVEE